MLLGYTLFSIKDLLMAVRGGFFKIIVIHIFQ